MSKLSFGCCYLLYLFQDTCIGKEYPAGFPEIEEVNDYRDRKGGERPKKGGIQKTHRRLKVNG